MRGKATNINSFCDFSWCNRRQDLGRKLGQDPQKRYCDPVLDLLDIIESQERNKKAMTKILQSHVFAPVFIVKSGLRQDLAILFQRGCGDSTITNYRYYVCNSPPRLLVPPPPHTPLSDQCESFLSPRRSPLQSSVNLHQPKGNNCNSNGHLI